MDLSLLLQQFVHQMERKEAEDQQTNRRGPPLISAQMTQEDPAALTQLTDEELRLHIVVLTSRITQLESAQRDFQAQLTGLSESFTSRGIPSSSDPASSSLSPPASSSGTPGTGGDNGDRKDDAQSKSKSMISIPWGNGLLRNSEVMWSFRREVLATMVAGSKTFLRKTLFRLVAFIYVRWLHRFLVRQYYSVLIVYLYRKRGRHAPLFTL